MTDQQRPRTKLSDFRDEDMLTPQEVMEVLQISRSSLARLVRNGRLVPNVMLNRRKMFPKPAILQMQASLSKAGADG